MDTPEKKESERDKKEYHSPIFRHYGTIRKITEAVGNMGNTDGGTGSMSKTAA